MKVVVIPTEGEPYEREVSGYQDLKEIVGGYIEMIAIRTPAGEAYGYCNEEGKLHRLPVNRLATSLYVHPGYDIIVGDVVIVGPPDEEGNETDIPQNIAQYLVSLG